MSLAKTPSRLSAEDWVNYTVVLLALLGFAFCLFRSSPGPALGDYVEWTYQGVLLRDVLQGHPDPAYWLKSYPVPNDLTTLGLGTLMLVLPWQMAAKLWLLAGTGLGLFAVHRLQTAASTPRQSWRLPVITAAALLGSTLWFGFFNFMLGTYFAMWVCALLLREAPSRWKYAVLLVLAFVSHMIPWFFALLAMALYAWQHRRFRLLLQAAPSGLLCVWYFAGRLLHGNPDAKADMVATARYMSPSFALFKMNSVLKSWGFINPAATDKDSLLLQIAGLKVFLLCFVCNAAVALLVLWLLARAARAAFVAHTPVTRTPLFFLWTTMALFCGFGLIMPGALAGISDPGARMLQVALWCGACVVATSRRSVRGALSACAAVLLAVNIWLMHRVMAQPPQTGSVSEHLPARIREFAHVYYGYGWQFYRAIPGTSHDLRIFPTAMFVRVDASATQKDLPKQAPLPQPDR